jgi:hypothetical protein
MSNELTNIYLRQGEGEDEEYMAMSLNNETIEMMTRIRQENPKYWEKREIDLFNEAVNRLYPEDKK